MVLVLWYGLLLWVRSYGSGVRGYGLGLGAMAYRLWLTGYDLGAMAVDMATARGRG